MPSLPGPKSKSPLAEMLAIAAPTVVTMTSYTVMQFVDGLMVSRIPGDDAYVAAQGNGGMLVWFFVAFALGTTGVINSFVSQNLGAGKPERGPAYAWAGMWMALVSALALALFIPFMPALFRTLGHFASHSQSLIRMETGYAQIMLAGIGFTVATRALSHYFYGMHRATVVMVAALVANLVNVFANAILIYGQSGPPEGTPFAPMFAWFAQTLNSPTMEVNGAALGTVIGSVVEFTIPLALFLGPKMHREFKTRAAWKPPRSVYKDILKVGWPAGAMFANEMICWGYLMAVLLAKAGKAAGENPDIHNTAGWIALRYMHLSFMPAVGVSIAMTAMVGKAMGMGRPDLAAQRTWLGVKVTMVYMGAMALAFILFREPMIRVFSNSSELSPESLDTLIRVGSQIMIAAAVFQVFDALAISISGALRGAGDTLWPGMVTIIASWVCIVGGGHLMIYLAPNMGSLGPWIGGAAYIIVLGILFLMRFLGGKWRTMSLVDAAHPGPRPMTEPSDPGPVPEIPLS